MNAKKIMGAVLVALLAAALFVGAGAAVDEKAAGTVFLYQLSAPSTIEDGVYSFGDASVEVKDGSVLPLNIEKFVDGAKYSNGTAYITVKLPNAGFTAVGNYDDSDADYDAMANGLIAGQKVQFTATPVVNGFTSSDVAAIIIYDADGVPTKYDTNSNEFNAGVLELNSMAKGTYQIHAVLAPEIFVGTAEPGQLLGQKYSFTVYSTEPTLTVSADSVIMGNFITVTITGVPGEDYYLDAEGFEFYAANQLSSAVTGTEGEDFALVNMPNSGKVVVYLKAGYDDGKQTLTLYAGNAAAAGDKKATANVKIEKGVITAVADEDSYFVGNPVGLSGTTTAGSKLFFYIEGTNFPFTQLLDADFEEAVDVENGKWTVVLDSAEITSGAKTLVAGTYTVVVSTYDNETDPVAQTELKDTVMSAVYGTAAITMKLPFLTGIEAAPVAIQDTDYDITGTAYSADSVRIYVFGTNFFEATGNVPVDDDDETFEFTIPKGTTKDMAPGTYFYLIQHPMNDGLFNVWVNDTADFYYAATYDAGEVNKDAAAYNDATFIFNAWKRGTNYAAQALLEAIAGQDIDDIFVQGTFEVEAQKLTINPIPAEVAKGTALTVSGTSNSGEGVEVIVNVLAGKFGATVKGDENSAIFLTAKAVTEDDGTFAATIDTSKLPVGAYIVTVELGGQMYDSAAVSIVDKAPVTPPADDKPDTPVTPPADDKPTEPETPGFGALAALAGLGAVAVLLLRRE